MNTNYSEQKCSKCGANCGGAMPNPLAYHNCHITNSPIDETAMQNAWSEYLISNNPLTYDVVRSLFESYENHRATPAPIHTCAGRTNGYGGFTCVVCGNHQEATIKAAPNAELVAEVAEAIKLRIKNARASDGSPCDHSHYFAESAFTGMAEHAIAKLAQLGALKQPENESVKSALVDKILETAFDNREKI